MATSEPKLSSAELLRHLKKKLDAVSDKELAELLGIGVGALTHWRKEATALTPLQVAGALAKARNAAKAHVHSNAIRPIVEFFPIDSVPVGKAERQLAVFPITNQ
jgi:hypothetical protein